MLGTVSRGARFFFGFTLGPGDQGYFVGGLVMICVALVMIWVAVDAPKAPELTRGEATFWWRTLSPIVHTP
jgi:hypothetical protein